MSTGTRFRKARDASGLTQVELSRRIGCDPSTVSRIERGEIRPSLNIARKWAEHCGVPLPELVDDDEASDSAPPGAP